jgi:hypothetical protein
MQRDRSAVDPSFLKLRGTNMGSKWFTGGVVAASHGRIQFDFVFDGTRYRPSIKRLPQRPTFVEPESASKPSNSTYG